MDSIIESFNMDQGFKLTGKVHVGQEKSVGQDDGQLKNWKPWEVIKSLEIKIMVV